MKYLWKGYLIGIACIATIGCKSGNAAEPVLLTNQLGATTNLPLLPLPLSGQSSIGINLPSISALPAVGHGGTNSTQLPSSLQVIQSLPAATSGGLVPVSDVVWDETAVRKVLFTFAFGGHATDAQIKLWADMTPQTAIKEILTFSPHNLKLSKPAVSDSPNMALKDGTLSGLGKFWSSFEPDNTVPLPLRSRFSASPSYARPAEIWAQSVLTRGLNPFRQKIGWWESNYHLAFSQQGRVNTQQVIAYYDSLMNAFASGKHYQDIMAMVAISAAIVTQYQLDHSRIIKGVCRCNEDFAREFYQLFFGILGDQDRQKHEEITVKETAKAFTGFEAPWEIEWRRLADYVISNQLFQYDGLLDILGLNLAGIKGNERIWQMAQSAILHEESLNNLPVKIVQGLADDRLTPAKIAQIRATWRAMPNKNLLEFLRIYAVSTQFHNANRVKYWTSVERNFNILSQLILDNQETYLNVHGNEGYLSEIGPVFRPSHTIFGGQTGEEAAASFNVFRKNYNRATQNVWRFARPTNGFNWQKDWRKGLQASSTNKYNVAKIAEKLWNRFIGDGLKNFGMLERAHLYALLARGRDFGSIADPTAPSRIYYTNNLTNNAYLMELINILGQESLALGDTNSTVRSTANYRIGLAVNFITTTPFAFAQEGR